MQKKKDMAIFDMLLDIQIENATEYLNNLKQTKEYLQDDSYQERCCNLIIGTFGEGYLIGLQEGETALKATAQAFKKKLAKK